VGSEKCLVLEMLCGKRRRDGAKTVPEILGCELEVLCEIHARNAEMRA